MKKFIIPFSLVAFLLHETNVVAFDCWACFRRNQRRQAGTAAAAAAAQPVVAAPMTGTLEQSSLKMADIIKIVSDDNFEPAAVTSNTEPLIAALSTELFSKYFLLDENQYATTANNFVMNLKEAVVLRVGNLTDMDNLDPNSTNASFVKSVLSSEKKEIVDFLGGFFNNDLSQFPTDLATFNNVTDD
jgi:hypothetical protein